VLVYTNTVPEEDAYVEEEFRALAETARFGVVAEIRQRRDSPDTHTFLGEGKVEELLDMVVESRADVVIVDDEISARQQHNLEEVLKCPVGDRSQLILDIFAQRAHTREGSLQVELAQHTYWLPRLMSRYTKFERQRGGTRSRGGPGEQKLEADRRKLYNRISTLKEHLADLERQRHLQREGRRRYPFPFAVLVGYTSAGKSTLLNTLSGSEVHVDSRLFATLDPTTRRVALPGGYSVFITDTVGFIRDLPTQLVAAFKATLEEVTFADFLILVIDASHPYWEWQRDAVYDTLNELDAGGKPIVTVFNKCDKVADTHRLVELVAATPDSAYISASEATGIDHLTDRLVAAVRQLLTPVEVLIPYSHSSLVSDCYEMGHVQDVEYKEGGILLKAEVAEEMAGRLAPFMKQ
jgi:GTP-binding protein HflX